MAEPPVTRGCGSDSGTGRAMAVPAVLIPTGGAAQNWDVFQLLWDSRETLHPPGAPGRGAGSQHPQHVEPGGPLGF